MKKLATIVLGLFCTVVALVALDVEIASFTARSNGSEITLEWESRLETSVSHYEILRSTNSTGNDYKYIATVDAKGSPGRYSFIDENAYMKGDNGSTAAGTLYTYKLKMVGSDGKSVYSDVVSVTHNVSSVRRTWGMIKDMFR